MVCGAVGLIGWLIEWMIEWVIGTDSLAVTKGWSASKIRHFLSKLLRLSVDHERLLKRVIGQWRA